MSEEMQTAVAEKTAATESSEVAALLKQQIKWTKICAIACILVLILAAVCAFWLAPQISTALDSISGVAEKLNAIDWDALVSNINKLASTGQGSMTDISDAISKLDIDGLNTAISDLQKAVSPLAKLFG